MRALQSVLTAVFPPQCAGCGELSSGGGALCGPCWRDMRFIGAPSCDVCGVPLLGEAEAGPLHCDDCIATARPWARGRAAIHYSGTGRRLVLALKHGDRLDLVPVAGSWMARAGRDILHRGAVVVPVPAHWTRLLGRRYNQAAELGRAVARHAGCHFVPDALKRSRKTSVLDGLDRDARFQTLCGAIEPALSRMAALADRDVIIVDDVMTSGASLAASAEAARAAGARDISILVLARVAKDY